MKNKLFLFGDYQALRQKQPQDAGFQTVPTALMRQGNFTELLGQATTTLPDPTLTGMQDSHDGEWACLQHDDGKRHADGAAGIQRQCGQRRRVRSGDVQAVRIGRSWECDCELPEQSCSAEVLCGV